MNHLRADRVEHDIPGQLHQVGMLVYQNPLEPTVEQMAATSMPSIRGLGENAVELPHAFGQITVRGLDQHSNG